MTHRDFRAWLKDLERELRARGARQSHATVIRLLEHELPNRARTVRAREAQPDQGVAVYIVRGLAFGEAEVRDIQRAYAERETQRSIASRWAGATARHISEICRIDLTRAPANLAEPKTETQ